MSELLSMRQEAKVKNVNAWGVFAKGRACHQLLPQTHFPVQGFQMVMVSLQPAKYLNHKFQIFAV